MKMGTKRGSAGRDERRRMLLPAVFHHAGRAAHDEFRLEYHLAHAMAVFSCNPLEYGLGRHFPHLPQGLADRRKTRMLIGSTINVIESYNRHILGDPQTVFVNRSDRAHGGNIIE